MANTSLSPQQRAIAVGKRCAEQLQELVRLYRCSVLCDRPETDWYGKREECDALPEAVKKAAGELWSALEDAKAIDPAVLDQLADLRSETFTVCGVVGNSATEAAIHLAETVTDGSVIQMLIVEVEACRAKRLGLAPPGEERVVLRAVESVLRNAGETAPAHDGDSLPALLNFPQQIRAEKETELALKKLVGEVKREGRLADALERDIHRAAVTEAKPIKRPPERALQAWRLRDLQGLKGPTEVAEAMTKHTDKKVHQGTVSRWLGQVEAYLAAGNILPDLPHLEKEPPSVDPAVIDMGSRQDRRTPRQRTRRDPDSDSHAG